MLFVVGPPTTLSISVVTIRAQTLRAAEKSIGDRPRLQQKEHAMTRSIARVLFLITLAALVAPAHAAAPAITTINGSPLKILIGDDTSYQVLNATIGTLGQIYPGPCTTGVADAGIFTVTGGVLYAPNFGQHPCGSAASIGPFTAWTPVSISPVSGAGTTSSPFSVTVVVKAGSSGVQLTATYTYVNGEPFFRIRKVFTATNPSALNIYTGADLFLASQDAGVPYLEPLSQSPGGKDCNTGTYTILLIPTTPADHYVALDDYSAVWSEIGMHGNLSDTIGTTCDDNGAALQWQRNVPAGGSVTITSAVSFGPIPPIVQFNVTSVSPLEVCRGADNVTVVINGIGFQNNTTFDFGPGITVTSTTINSATQATVTLNVAASAATGPRSVTGTQSPGGLTATLANALTVNDCAERCGHITDVRVRCTTDGTGDYLISFTFRNDSAQPVQHLFLTGLGSATATPNAINFGTAVPPGASRAVGPIRIHGALPGPLTMTINVLNAERELCCSFDVPFELPDCDCAQIVDQSGPSCRPGGGYSYTFAYQSLSMAPLQYLLLTPEIPSTAAFNPGVITLSPPMIYGEIRTFTIDINNVAAGQSVCFRITAKTERCEHCCSTRVCVLTPRCIDDPLPYDDTVYNARTIRSISGNLGVSFPLPPDTTRVDLAWEEIEEELPSGSFIEQRYVGREGVIAATRAVATTDRIELRTTFDALHPTRYRYSFLNDGVLVGTRGGVRPDDAPICNGCGAVKVTTDAHFARFPTGELQHTEASEEFPPSCNEPGFPCLFAGYTFPEATQWLFTQSATKFLADEVRVWPEDGLAIDASLTNVELRAQGPHEITFTEVSVTVDCNANGVDDLTDIANGTSADFDRNGVPDECQGRGANLDLSLNTGINDDWRVLNTGFAVAARVVRNPPSAWSAPFANSAWVSVRDTGASLPGITSLQFENCFCIGNGASTATLDLDVRADNFATVFLNDEQVSATGGAFNGAPLEVLLTGRVGGEGPFRTGRNCVRVQVSDQGISTGLDVSGTVRAEHGACP
jgi:hypothetical protein